MFDFYYTYFHTLFKISLPIAGILIMKGAYINYLINGKRWFYRNINYSPIVLRIKSYFNQTFLGKINLLFYVGFDRFKDKYLIDILSNFYNNPFYNRLRLIMKGGIIGVIMAILFHEYILRNDRNILFYNMIELNEFQSSYDLSKKFIEYSLKPNLANEIISDEVKLKIDLLKGNIQPRYDEMIYFNGRYYNKNSEDLICNEIDLLQYAKLMSSVGQEEISSQCYYLAYLKNKNIGVNSNLKFSTKNI